MHADVRSACEYLLLRNALQVASAQTAALEIPPDLLHRGLCFELVDERGTCAALEPIDTYLRSLEPRDVADAGVHAELARLAPSAYVDALVDACAFFRAAAEHGVAVDDTLALALSPDGIPHPLPASHAAFEELVARLKQLPQATAPQEIVPPLPEQPHLPVLPVVADVPAATNAIQGVAHDLLARTSP